MLQQKPHHLVDGILGGSGSGLYDDKIVLEIFQKTVIQQRAGDAGLDQPLVEANGVAV